MKPYQAIYALVMLVAFSPQAQERAAAGALESQMTWSTLSNQIKTVDTKVDALNSRFDKMVECGNDGKLYAPAHPDALNGCLDIVLKPKPQEVVYSGTPKTTSFSISCTQGRTILSATAGASTNYKGGSCGLQGNQSGCDHQRTDCIGKSSCGWTADGKNYYGMYIVCN